MEDTLEDAVISDSIQRVRQVLDTPAAVSPSDLTDGLALAAGNRTLDIARLLYGRGANVNGNPGDNENCPLHKAVKHRNVPFIIFLAARGADLDRDVGSSFTATVLAVMDSDGFPVLQALLEVGADPNSPESSVYPLGFAIFNRNMPALALLLQQGADPNYESAYFPSALTIAASLSLPIYVEVLLAAGAHPGMGEHRPRHLPLQPAVLGDEFGADGVEVVRMLLKAGAGLMEWGSSGQRPLLEAVFRAWDAEGPTRAALGAAAALLIAAGDRGELDSLPMEWPGLEAALAPVWHTTPQYLSDLFPLLEPWAQVTVRSVLRLGNRYDLPELAQWRLVGKALGDAGRDLGLYQYQ